MFITGLGSIHHLINRKRKQGKKNPHKHFCPVMRPLRIYFLSNFNIFILQYCKPY